MQIYNLNYASLKWNKIIYLYLFLIVIGSCKKDPCEALYCYNNGYCDDGNCVCPPGYYGKFCENMDNSGGNSNGQVIFWEQEGSFCSKNTTIIIDGVTREISKYFHTGIKPIDCDYEGSAVFTLSPGSYNYQANCEGNSKYGTVKIDGGTCEMIQLSWTGGGSGGGGGGGGTCAFSNAAPSQSWILNYLIGFNYSGTQTSKLEAEQMLRHLCAEVQIHYFTSGEAVCGKFPNNYHITIFPNTYNKPSVYVIRYGLDVTHGFNSSNNTYFEIDKGGSGGGGGGGGSNPTHTMPSTILLASQCDRFSSPTTYWTQQFTLTSPRSLVLRFSSQFIADCSIIAPAQLTNFQSGRSYTGLAGFDNKFGYEYLTLQAGTYYLAMRNQSSGPNRVSVELDYDIDLPASDRCSFVDIVIGRAENIAAGGKFWESFTISNGYRYFLDGCNSGDVDVHIIPQNQLTAFRNNQTFLHFSEYNITECGSGPGLDEIILGPGTYYLAASNSSNEHQTLNYVMERWKQN